MRLSSVVLGLVVLAPLARAQAGDPLATQTQAIGNEVLTHGHAYDDLAELTKGGPRLAGSPGAEKAVEWAKAKLAAYGFDKVSVVPTTVPHWTRGEVETATLHDGHMQLALKIAALGGSIGTAKGGLEAPVVEVRGLDEVEKLGEAVRGKIVFYNRPMDPSLADTFEAYGGAIDQRVAGASQAARYGAVAVLVRSLSTLADDDHPHTGSVNYRIDAPRIPAAALSTHAANELSRHLKANPRSTVRVELSAASHGMVPAVNVVGDLVGRERPDEVVLVSGHLDSWDLGPGAHDDGSGAVQAIEVGRALKALGLKPRRTVRVVLWMAEEEGGIGAKDYATAVKKAGLRHVAALESDRGGFAPVGFETDAGDEVVAKLRGWSKYLAPLHADQIKIGHAGTDVEPLKAQGAATIGYVPVPTHYFDLHHSALDQMTAVKKDELLGGAAAMAALTWLFAEEPDVVARRQ